MRYRDIRLYIAGKGTSPNQIYNILCFVSFLFGIFAACQSLVAALSPYVVAVNFAFSGLFALLYVLSRVLGRTDASWLAGPVFLLFVFIPAIWVFNGGTSSGTAYVVILFDSFIVVLATGDEARLRERIVAGIAVCALIAVVCLLLWLEYNRPELIYTYADKRIRYLDIATSMVIAVIGNYLILRTYVSQHHKDFARIEKYSKTLEVLVQTDAMTGLVNHAHGIIRLDEEIAKSHRYGRRLSVIMMDLDWFKRINDEFGHQAGDDVIVYFSACLKRCSRTFDVTIRYGGEEFILILPETGLESAVTVGERVRTYLRVADPSIPRAITVSGGIVECMSDDTADSMVKRADDLMYRAKQSGRDRFLAG